jgi:tRNA(Ile)-lysidine synthase
LKEKYNLELIIAHVNYKLRGKDSDKDEQLVKKLAKKYNLPIEIIRNTKYEIRDTNLEEKLRNLRYDFFEKIRKNYKANAIAVAHNLNDQAETVLMRVLRGTGLRGLGAIRFKNDKIIRPLLNIPRKEILAYLHKNNLIYRVDKSNLGLDFTRNKIRNKLFPYIEKNFNPRVQKILFKFSESAAADYDFIARYAKEWLAANKTLQVSVILKLHPSILREVLRQAIEKHNPVLRDIESAHIDEILKMLKSSKNKRQRIAFKGLKIERRGDRLMISKI